MALVSDLYGVTFDAWTFLAIGRHQLNLGDDGNRICTATEDSRLLSAPLPPRLNHIFSQANFIGNEVQSQVWNKKSSLTYRGNNIAPNEKLKDVSFPTSLGTLPSKPLSLFYHQVVTNEGINQARTNDHHMKTLKSHRMYQTSFFGSKRATELFVLTLQPTPGLQKKGRPQKVWRLNPYRFRG